MLSDKTVKYYDGSTNSNKRNRRSILTPNLKPHLLYRIQQNYYFENPFFFKTLKNRSQSNFNSTANYPKPHININNDTAKLIKKQLSFDFNNTFEMDSENPIYMDLRIDNSSK